MDELERRAKRALVQQLESLRRAGVEQLPKPKGNARASAAVETPAVVEKKAAKAVSSVVAPVKLERLAAPAATPAVAKSSKSQMLNVLNGEVCACEKCPELVANRTQTVFGVGNIDTRLVFFGEAPGADEDRQGEPFVGKAGQLLNKIIEACTLKREDIYIMNVLKCRPPDNRPPADDEIEHCRPFFERQLDILRPEFICCLGMSALKSLFPEAPSLGRMRGKLHEWRGMKVLVTYHPAYLLRNPPAKKDTWDDMKLLMREMGIELPTPQG